MDFSKLSKEELIQEIKRLNDKVENQSEEISILKKYIFARKNEKWTKEDKEKSQTFNEKESTSSLSDFTPF